jgi:uncharacterized protein YbaA (DUF1428 family)
MTYVDGYVVPVPTAHREAYRQVAMVYAGLFKEHGALSVVECWGDAVPEGTLTSFPMAVKREPGETVVFSWVTWPSRELRDAAWKKLADDPRMQPGQHPDVFDGKRLIYGGFEVLLSV